MALAQVSHTWLRYSTEDRQTLGCILGHDLPLSLVSGTSYDSNIYHSNLWTEHKGVKGRCTLSAIGDYINNASITPNLTTTQQTLTSTTATPPKSTRPSPYKPPSTTATY